LGSKDRIFLITTKYKNRKRECNNCGVEIKLGEHVYSKANSRKANYYHLNCAYKLNLIDRNDFRRKKVN